MSIHLYKNTRRHWEHYKLSTGNTNGKVIDPDDVKCVKIPEEELTDFEKKKIETFEPPTQLGLPEVNEVVKSTKQPMTTKKTTSTKEPPKSEEKVKTAEKVEEDEEETDQVNTTEKKTTTTATTTTKVTKTKATVKPQTIKPSDKMEDTIVAPPNPETTQASFMELDTTVATIDEVTQVRNLLTSLFTQILRTG